MNYYNEIESYIKKNEVNKKARLIEENQNILTNYWNIGRLLIEAQGGSKRAQYGNALIKEWSIKYKEKYGSGYDATNLSRFRQFYIYFPILGPVAQISWSNIVKILPIKEENKRNYYINLCLKNNLSKRELIKEIKNNSYERLIDKPEKIELITISKKNSILENMKDPILIELDESESITNEHDLESILLAKLKVFFTQLGEGYALMDNQYKLTINNQNYYIDILLFNVNFNCYVVVELKYRELRKEDKSQIEFYMNYIDKQIKKEFHNKTIGIIITKKQNKLIANFVRSESIIPLTYKLENK